MSAGKIRLASIEKREENILGVVAGVGGGIPSLANGATSVRSQKINCLGARAVYFVLSGTEDPSAVTTASPGYYLRAELPVQTNGANFAATDTNFGSATNSKGVVYRVLPATGGPNFNVILPFEQVDITITNAGAAPITNVRLDAIVVM